MSFDRIARSYRWLEYGAFGRELERRRSRYLGDLSGRQRALVLGDGDGRFLATLTARHPGMRIDYIDGSAKMLALARQRISKTANVQFYHADAMHWQYRDAEYDLVATHFFLDCFTNEQLRTLIAKVAAATQADALWIVSEFRHATGAGIASVRTKAWIAILYRFFRLTANLQVDRLPDYGPILTQHAFRLLREERVAHDLLVSQLWVRSLPLSDRLSSPGLLSDNGR